MFYFFIILPFIWFFSWYLIFVQFSLDISLHSVKLFCYYVHFQKLKTYFFCIDTISRYKLVMRSIFFVQPYYVYISRHVTCLIFFSWYCFSSGQIILFLCTSRKTKNILVLCMHHFKI